MCFLLSQLAMIIVLLTGTELLILSVKFRMKIKNKTKEPEKISKYIHFKGLDCLLETLAFKAKKGEDQKM